MTTTASVGEVSSSLRSRSTNTIALVIKHLNGFRTAEAHLTGKLRKSALGRVPIGESEQVWLFAHWNIALGTMKALHRTLDELACG